MSHSDVFDYENADETVWNPEFLCELCGFANVRLVDVDGPKSGAKCTHCGAVYMNTDQ